MDGITAWKVPSVEYPLTTFDSSFASLVVSDRGKVQTFGLLSGPDFLSRDQLDLALVDRQHTRGIVSH
jgi:hypothetical protein